tara:strand:+ start:253 stop:453 length:201 start_codon:yes stop_codon:yes gene_type:complete
MVMVARATAPMRAKVKRMESLQHECKTPKCLAFAMLRKYERSITDLVHRLILADFGDTRATIAYRL